VTRYPPVKTGKRYLNSGLFIGYAAELYELVKNATLFIENDQEYYTEAYLDEKVRSSLRIGLDHQCEIFQTFENTRNNLHLVYNGNAVNKNAFTYSIINLKKNRK
jgi:procollagen-lysine,2-oxoglutarate 5-dioxygenase, invertebrate